MQKETLISKLTSKYQATVPKAVRKMLDLKEGDRIVFEVTKKQVLLRKSTPLDLKFAKALENTLSEWNSPHDEEAYSDL